jgi:hypothetical protein
MGGFWDFGYLILIAIALVIFWWPIGAWHLWSWMWLTIFIVVVVFEVIGYFWSPEKKTISNQMRKYRQLHPKMFWAVQILLWLGFAYALAVHLAT